jgi:CRP-like cAMP-binding protein
MSEEKRAVLRRVRAFADLADDECDAVLAVLKAKKGAPGDTLFKEGDRGDSLMIVLDGKLVARVRTASGGEEEVATLGPGEVVGEMAFVDAEPRSATVSSPQGATILEFTRMGLALLRRDKPRVAAAIQRNVLADVARRLRDAGDKLTDGAGPRSMQSPPSIKRTAKATVEQLRALPALSAFGQDDLELLAHVATVRKYAARELLMKEGDAGEVCLLLATGTVSVTRAGMPIATLGPPAMVGQLALLDRAPRSATVTALEETIVLEVPATAFQSLVRAHSPIALRFQEQIALAGVRQLREATRRVAESQSRLSAAPSSTGFLDDWDTGDEAAPDIALELDRGPR